MRITNVHVQGFRCLHDVEADLDDLTILIGANGSGKSSMLRALDWFFSGEALEPDDICGHDAGLTVSVRVRFSDLTVADRAALGRYGSGGTADFWRTQGPDGSVKLTGRGTAYRLFEQVRANNAARELSAAYRDLREARPDLDLPSTRSAEGARAAMDEWEQLHPESLEEATSSATHLFGFAGQPRLGGRFDYVFVPAVADVGEETRDARGTLLQRLLQRTSADPEQFTEQMADIVTRANEQFDAVIRRGHEPGLEALSRRVTGALRQWVAEANVNVALRPAILQPPRPSFDMRVADGGVETDVTRQGHGFQRALLLATLHELAVTNGGGDAPAIFLAIEEPELYQHPVQGRHFARVLSDLPRTGEGAVQVCYATHSPIFLNASNFGCVRRFNRGPNGRRFITVARGDRVWERIHGLVAAAEVPARLRLTLQRSLAEAIFADAVLLVEGRSDAGLLSGLADRRESLESRGIAVAETGGKTALPMAWAILTEIGIPVYLVFDGDAPVSDETGQLALKESNPKKKPKQDEARRWNRALLRMLGEPETDWPPSSVAPRFAVFHRDIEAEWPHAIDAATTLAEREGDPRVKPDDWYREAAADPAVTAPPLLEALITAVYELT